MASITVEDVSRTREPGCGDAQRRRGMVSLEPGQRLRFGRGGTGVDVDLRLSGPQVSRYAGTIRAVADYWLLTNASTSTYVVENLEGGGEHVKVPPRRVEAPIPFELSRLLIPADGGSYDLHVYAPQHAHLSDTDDAPPGDTTQRPFAMEASAKYFRVLVALCEPRLRNPSSVAIPTSDDIARRIACGGGEPMSRSAVDYHIDYLAETKLRLRSTAGAGAGQAESKRAALVSLALRFDLVTQDDLMLLPARRSAARHG